jgi:serine/threonine-protein kinase
MIDTPDRFSVDFTGVTLLGQYQVDEKLADGGMGAVYLATDTNLGQRVAVKVPHPRFLGEPGFRERFAAEVEELVRLEHPHVARILARGEHDQVPFFVLQYLGGGNLEDLIGAGRMSAAEVAAWLVPTAETLDFVHSRGIIHRDVKPANILFDEEGHVFLSDFGVAKAIHADSGGLTATGMGIGSPKYMAPEQGTGGEVGPAADQYGLASAVYEALAGKPPFGGDDPLRILVRKQQEPPRPIEEPAPEVRPSVAKIVMRALSKDPAERFESCVEFAEAFAAGISTTTLPLVDSGPPTDGGVTVGIELSGAKALLVLGGVLAVIVFAVLGLVGAFSSDDPEPAEPPPAEAPPADPVKTEDGKQSRTFVDLIEPGAKPHKVLRYRLAAGATERMRMIWLAEMDLKCGEEEMKSPGAIPMEFDSDLAIDSVGEDGRVAYRWTLGECRIRMPEGREMPEGSEKVTDPLKRMFGLVAKGSLDLTGLNHELKFEEAEEKGQVAHRFRTGISEGLRRLCVPLPDEPVGVGARWDITESVAVGGMRFTGTTRYELLSVEGWRIRVKFSSRMFALGQDVFPPGFEGAGEFEATEHSAKSEGESLIDLTQLVPRETKSRDEMTLIGIVRGEGKEMPFRMNNVVNTTLERR